MMEYKGYIRKVEFNDEAGIFHGEVINTRDVITFQGESVAELKKAFRESVSPAIPIPQAIVPKRQPPYQDGSRR